MTTMLEKMAEAIKDAAEEAYVEHAIAVIDGQASGPFNADPAILARAALLAIREPSEGMTNAAPEVDGIPLGGAAANVWTAMIDAILSGEA